MIKTPIILDTDPGIDDAVAITLALHEPSLELLLITTVAGNVSVEQTTQNAQKLIDFYGKSTPIAKGAAGPLLRESIACPDIHGESGMDGYSFPKPKAHVLGVHAVEALRETLLKSQERITLVPIGPLTNIALLFALYPETKAKVERIVLMGGSLMRGNTTTAAEFNFYADPHAAAMVFASGVHLVMVGLDLTTKALISPQNIEDLKGLNRAGSMLHSLFAHYRGGSMSTGLRIHDACAIAYLCRPELFTTQEVFVEIVTQGPAQGCAVSDLKPTLATASRSKKANATACLDIDAEAFRAWLMQSLGSIRP